MGHQVLCAHKFHSGECEVFELQKYSLDIVDFSPKFTRLIRVQPLQLTKMAGRRSVDFSDSVDSEWLEFDKNMQDEFMAWYKKRLFHRERALLGAAKAERSCAKEKLDAGDKSVGDEHAGLAKQLQAFLGQVRTTERAEEGMGVPQAENF